MGFKIETARKPARVTFRDGSTLHGAFFVSAGARSPDGFERVIDLLNSEKNCIPFEDASGDILLILRGCIARVLLEKSDMEPAPPYIKPAPARFLFNSGEALDGCVFIDLPKGRSRLSDYVKVV